MLTRLKKLDSLTLRLDYLQKLSIGDCQISDREIRLLVEAAPNLTELAACTGMHYCKITTRLRQKVLK